MRQVRTLYANDAQLADERVAAIIAANGGAHPAKPQYAG
jgi:hypothetical protein